MRTPALTLSTHFLLASPWELPMMPKRGCHALDGLSQPDLASEGRHVGQLLGRRLGAATAIGTSLPAWMKGSAEGRLSKII